MKQNIKSALLIIVLLTVIVVMCINIFGGDNRDNAGTSQTEPQPVTTAAPVTQPPVITAPVTQPPSSANVDSSVTAAVTQPTEAPTDAPLNTMPQTTKEIIDKYTFLVNKFKEEKPAYKKKEFQELPEEYRNLGGAANIILGLASGFMVSEEECELFSRPANAQEILWDLPVHNTEKGCVLTDYDAVSRAKCEDMGDGTYKISFSLKEEINAEPTPSDTLIPISAHGAVMQPISRKDIIKEVEKVTSTVPGISVNSFDLYYRDCEFICVYDPKTDQVLSITHNIVIDISADIQLFLSQINGTARLLNYLFIQDITW